MSGLTSFVSLYSLARGNNANAFLAGGTWRSDTFANPPLELWASFRTAGRDLGALGDLKLESVQRLVREFLLGEGGGMGADIG